jgi:hypothetical protein
MVSMGRLRYGFYERKGLYIRKLWDLVVRNER